jgi:hypothetical protein
MPDTALNQQTLVALFAEALNARRDHVTITHADLSAAWPGNPEGTSSLKRLLEVVGDGWTADYRDANGDYVFSRKPSVDDLRSAGLSRLVQEA